jgi:zinc transporter 9
MAGGSKTAVASAIAGNSVLTIAKFGAFLFTGSAAMMSEAMHSLADTMNQVLLMVGIRRSTRQADQTFPFGYGAERAVWALMSAVGIFFLGCGVTLYHGVHSFLHPKPLQELGVAILVLLFSFVVEFAVLVIAVRTVLHHAKGRPFFAYLRREADPTTAAVVMEDAAACLGVLLALAGIALSRWTGKPQWDAMASIAIGLLLGAIAMWLVARSRYLLVGPAVAPEVRQRIREILAGNPVVEKIAHLRTRVLDTETFRVSADVEFDGEAIADWTDDDLRAAYDGITNYHEFREFTAKYADRVMERLGDEVDAIEAEIQREFPEARYLDIEAD